MRNGAMSTNRFFTRMDSYMQIFRSAVEVAGAVESGRKPAVRDLRRLGVDPQTFVDIVGRRF
jgi:hypothetical protein